MKTSQLVFICRNLKVILMSPKTGCKLTPQKVYGQYWKVLDFVQWVINVTPLCILGCGMNTDVVAAGMNIEGESAGMNIDGDNGDSYVEPQDELQELNKNDNELLHENEPMVERMWCEKPGKRRKKKDPVVSDGKI
uniref:Uncharacterized protein n=1 Tax=Salix viminalis TaxID=40686 RepID=A0A6N2LA99_SALVM